LIRNTGNPTNITPKNISRVINFKGYLWNLDNECAKNVLRDERDLTFFNIEDILSFGHKKVSFNEKDGSFKSV
jgi:hypothetical protein